MVVLGKGIVEGCEIFANKVAGVLVAEGGDPTVRDCTIHDNEHTGVAVTGNGTVEDCDIFANGVGVVIDQGGNPTIRDCKIHGLQGNGRRVRQGAGQGDGGRL